MGFPNGPGLLQTPETLPFPPKALAVEGEPKQYGENSPAARNAQHHFQVFSQHVTDYAFITFDLERRITSWSRGAEHIFGYAEAEILGHPGNVLFTPEDRSLSEF